MAQLMFKIANEPHLDIRTVKPDLPACLVAIIDRALIKDADQRYQTGGEMAKDLRACLAQIGGAGGASATAPTVDIAI